MSRIIALVTLYNPKKNEIKNCEILSKQVDKLILCDNSEESHEEFFERDGNIIYTSQYKNQGISGAFNSVLKQPKFEWQNDDVIIFFDQDSRIDDNYINILYKEFCHIEKVIPNMGCLGPVFYNTSSEKVEEPKLRKKFSKDTFCVNNIITSSLMTRYSNLERIGFWNENTFLDMADWDLCWRMQNAGLICCMTKRVTLCHSVGNGEKKVGFIRLRVGQPFREYYQTRDSLYLLKENYVPFKMRLRLIANVTVRPIVHFIFMNEKRTRIKYIKEGFRDYKKGIKGNYKPVI